MNVEIHCNNTSEIQHLFIQLGGVSHVVGLLKHCKHSRIVIYVIDIIGVTAGMASVAGSSVCASAAAAESANSDYH